MSIEQSTNNRAALNEIGKWLVWEQGSKIIPKLQQQGVLPQGAVEVKISEEAGLDIYTHPEFIFFREEGRVQRGDKAHYYTPLETNILNFLVENVNRLTTFRQLGEKCWGYKEVNDSKLFKMHIGNIRRGLADVGVNNPHQTIKTHHGVGYEFRDPSCVNNEKSKPT